MSDNQLELASPVETVVEQVLEDMPALQDAGAGDLSPRDKALATRDLLMVAKSGSSAEVAEKTTQLGQAAKQLNEAAGDSVFDERQINLAIRLARQRRVARRSGRIITRLY